MAAQAMSECQGNGALSLVDIEQAFAEMFNAFLAKPAYILVSPKTMAQLRLYTWISRAHSLPRRKLRKCWFRKRQAAIRQGRRRIERRFVKVPGIA